jgi:hypothetical protein
MFYVIRYQPDVPLDERKHSQTLGRFETWADADAERERREHASLLEAVGPRSERAA